MAVASVALAAAWSASAVAAPTEILEFSTGVSSTDAGAHADVSASIKMAYDPPTPLTFPRTVQIDLPPGVMGNPNAVDLCPREVLAVSVGGTTFHELCPPSSQIGVADLVLNDPGNPPGRGAVYAFDAGPGKPALIGLGWFATPAPLIDVHPRTESDFGISTISTEVNSQLAFYALDITIWGVPGAHERGGFQCGLFCFQPVIPPDPEGERKAFMTNPTVCDEPKVTTLRIDTYRAPGEFLTETSTDPTPTNCDQVPFEPALDLAPSSSFADGATGLQATMTVPHTDDADVLGSSHLRRAQVTLPEGVSLNPSVADGLIACTDAQFADGSREPARCPEESKIGTVEFDVPILPDALQGSIYIGQPLSTDPQSSTMFRVFQYAEGYGMTVKIPGYAKADPVTGQVTAVFEDLPQVPLGTATLTFRGGPRGVLALPDECGVRPWSATFTPWAGGPDVVRQGTFAITEGCGKGFAPTLTAGMSSAEARGGGDFAFSFAREEGEQALRGLTATLPRGLLARIRGVPLCRDEQAAAGVCPDASRIGSVDAEAGSGKPFQLERPGDVYLTEGYKGGEYGLMVKIPVEAGPFRGDVALSPVIVRQAIHVDRATAQVRAVSDPLPLIHHGIPLRLRRATVTVDRSEFMVNPSGCSRRTVEAELTSDRGVVARRAQPFSATGCAGLPFEPRIGMRLTGPRQRTTGRHPGVRAVVRQAGVAEAGIRRARVTLPPTLALDPDNAQALCEFEDGTKPDLEDHCPKGSIVGRARAKTPLLDRDLVGNVYFVKNVRIDPDTGNEIRTLPMLIVALRGEIAINLRGVSSTTKGGRLVNTFAGVPDAPITRFNLNVKGGKAGILAVTGSRRGPLDVCDRRQVAIARTNGHNGKRHDFAITVRTPCSRVAPRKR
ncbi:MAG: hypothetical protein GXY03_00525 [Solirubrobacterales bacterium]|nr:hypothetical protein [Solirubrobacterales bacterium]